MCRHAGYVGPATAVGPVMTGLSHSLEVQASHACEMLKDSTVNADGFGLAWFNTEVQPQPARYANPAPIWSDPSIASMGNLIHSSMFQAAVRSATVAGTTAAANCAPFVDDAWSFGLNGSISEFQESWRSHFMAEWVSPERHSRVKGVTDSEWLFQAFLTRLDTGLEPIAALRGIMADVIARADEIGSEAQLNILAANGEILMATKASNQELSNSLYHVFDPEEFPQAHLVASEPLMDDPEWEPVEEADMLVLQSGGPPVRMKIQA